MNTLKIRKGEDVEIYVNRDRLFFVTGFSAMQSSKEHRISEYLCENAVSSVVYDKRYNITITAYSHLDKAVFDKENFSIFVDDKESVVEYKNCRLNKVETDVFASKPVINKFMITALDMSVVEGFDG